MKRFGDIDLAGKLNTADLYGKIILTNGKYFQNY